MLNSPLVLQCAAETSKQHSGGSDDERIDLAYRLALGRFPSAAERNKSRQFLVIQKMLLKDVQDESAKQSRVWANYFHVLFNLAEFQYIH